MINDSPFPLAVAAQYLVLLKEAAYAPPDVTGDLEGGFKASREQVIEAVVELIVNELKTGNAYLYYANALRDLSHHSIAEEFRDHAADETDHTDYLMRRLSVIAGESVQLPDVPSPPALSDPAEIIATMIRIEQEGIAKWRLLRGMIGDENPMRYQVEHFLVTEQEHLDELHQLLPAAPAAPAPELGNPEAPPPKVASARDLRIQALVSDVLEKRAADDEKKYLVSDRMLDAGESVSRRLQGASIGAGIGAAGGSLVGGKYAPLTATMGGLIGGVTGLVMSKKDPEESRKSLKAVREDNLRRVGGGVLGYAAGKGLKGSGMAAALMQAGYDPRSDTLVWPEDGAPRSMAAINLGHHMSRASALGLVNQLARVEQAKRREGRQGEKTASLGAHLRSKLAATMSDAMPAAQTALDHIPGARVAPGAGPLAPVQPVEPIPEGVPADLLDPGAEQQLAIEEQGRMQEAEEAASYFQEQAQGKEMLLQQLQQQLQQTAQQLQQTAQQLQQEQQEKQQAQQMVQQASSTANQALTGQLQAQQQALQSRQTATQALGTHESFRQQLRELIDPPPPALAPMGGDPSMQPPPGAPPGAEQAMAPKTAAGLNDIPLDAAADVLKHGPKKTLLTVGLPAVVAAATGIATHLRHRNAPEAVSQAQQHLDNAERAYSAERSHTNAIKLLAAKAQVGAAEIARDYPTATAVAATGAGYGLARAAVGAGTNVHTRVSRMMENHRKSKGGRPNPNAVPDFAKGP